MVLFDSIDAKLRSEWKVKVLIPFINSHIGRLSGDQIIYLRESLQETFDMEAMFHIKMDWNWENLSGKSCLTIEDVGRSLGYVDISAWDWSILSSHPNITMTDIMDHPTYPWKTYYVSSNTNLNIDIVNKFATKKWAWKIVSSHKNITMQNILQYPEFPWDIKSLCNNPNFNLSVYFKWPHRLWNWSVISRHENITMEIISSNRLLPWDWNAISYNPNLTTKMVSLYNNMNWDWEYLSRSPLITVEFILEHPQYKWFWRAVNENPNLTMDLALDNPQKLCWNKELATASIEILEKIQAAWRFCFNHKVTRELSVNPNISEEFVEKSMKSIDWVWSLLSKHPNISLKYIFSHNYAWDWDNVSLHPKLTMKDVTQQLNRNQWNWRNISRNPNVTIEDILANHLLNWHWDIIMQSNKVKPCHLSRIFILHSYTIVMSRNNLFNHPNITMADVINHPNIPWNYRYVSVNPNLTMEMINEYPNKEWDWVQVLKSKFVLEEGSFVSSNTIRICLVSMLDQEYDNYKLLISATILARVNDYKYVNTVEYKLLSNDYILSFIIQYV